MFLCPAVKCFSRLFCSYLHVYNLVGAVILGFHIPLVTYLYEFIHSSIKNLCSPLGQAKVIYSVSSPPTWNSKNPTINKIFTIYHMFSIICQVQNNIFVQQSSLILYIQLSFSLVHDICCIYPYMAVAIVVCLRFGAYKT